MPFLSEANRNDLPPLVSETLREVDRADRVWRRLKKKKLINITSAVIVDSTNIKGQRIGLTATLLPLRLTRVHAIEFPLTQLRHASEQLLTLHNPCQFPVRVGIDMLDEYADGEVSPMLSNLFDLSSEDLRLAQISKSLFTAAPANNSNPGGLILPFSNYTFVLRYRPELAGLSGTTLLIRNNLTIVEKMTVAGEGGRGTFGFPKSQPTIVDGGLSFPVEAKDLAYCSRPGGMTAMEQRKRFTYNVTIVNRGNMPVAVGKMTVNGVACNLHGFYIRGCEPFELKPKTPHTLTVDFQPDFTSSLVRYGAYLDLSRAPYVLYGVKYIHLVSLMTHRGLPARLYLVASAVRRLCVGTP